MRINLTTSKFTFTYHKKILSSVAMLFMVTGMAGFTGPWWQPILFAALDSDYLGVDNEINYVLSAVLVAIGAAVLAFKYFYSDEWARQITKDKETLNANLTDINSPYRYLQNLVDDHCYLSSQDTKFHHAFTVFRTPQTAFQYRRTIELYCDFSKQAKDLHDFAGMNFFSFSNDHGHVSDCRYCLAPQLNMDREMVFYDQDKTEQYSALATELHQRVKTVKASYDAFLKHAREIGVL